MKFVIYFWNCLTTQSLPAGCKRGTQWHVAVSLIPFHYRETPHIGYGYICPSPWLYRRKIAKKHYNFVPVFPTEEVDLHRFLFLIFYFIKRISLILFPDIMFNITTLVAYNLYIMVLL